MACCGLLQQALAALVFPFYISLVFFISAIEHTVVFVDLIDRRKHPLLRGYKIRTTVDMDCTHKTVGAVFLGLLFLPPCAFVLFTVSVINIIFFLLDMLLSRRGIHWFDVSRMWLLRNLFVPVANLEKNLLCSTCKCLKKYDIVLIIDETQETEQTPDPIPFNVEQQHQPNNNSSEDGFSEEIGADGTTDTDNGTGPGGSETDNEDSPPPPPPPSYGSPSGTGDGGDDEDPERDISRPPRVKETQV
ncbi:protein E27 [Proboscivirus elephantidbeta4]|uniref:Protein E27 n=1 Tax=Elephant endotheliotropic herpesvirus 4 TaxID=548914 RepID=A0A0S1TPN3_9BETA|nr:protein E27 [Elephant endotheliotropic herpesvirus 4]ALM25962.1 protein E27 [Elephant endotheliotropic herpesvirus 4]